MGKIYRISEFAKRIGKSAKTLRRWDTEGILKAKGLERNKLNDWRVPKPRELSRTPIV